MPEEKFTILDFRKKKERGEKITALTAYDYPMARAVDSAGIDVVLVGDSVGMVMLGYDSTTPVTMDEMIHHAKAVRRGTKRAFIVGDMPFMSYQASDEEAVRNAGRFVKEAGSDAVKVEGGAGVIPRIIAIQNAGIVVIGHIGLTPQCACKLGGYKVQGRDEGSAKKILEDAVSLETAGCCAIVLECIPQALAERITKKLTVPTIGIGAGPYCDGQVLVTHDIIGYYDRLAPKFVKRYADVGAMVLDAVKRFKKETETGEFPDKDHSFA